MRKRVIGLFIFMFYTISNLSSQSIIKIVNNNLDKVDIAVFEPYYNKFYNHTLPSTTVVLSFKDTLIKKINIAAPIFIKISFNHIPVYLFIEPSDTVVLNIKNYANISNSTPIYEWINFEGKNQYGLICFNQQFSYPYPTSKFELIYNLLRKQILNKDLFLSELKGILEASTVKYDSLFLNNCITKNFRDITKKTIKAN